MCEENVFSVCGELCLERIWFGIIITQNNFNI